MDEGLILGRYRPLAELGEGGHGAVELAFDTKMARRVAIKRIPVSRRGVELLERTTGLREARTAALLNHPNIVTVHEWETDDDEAFLIMEHVDGASLSELLDEYAPLEPDEAAAVLGPVADAIEYAHANGVLHLDLKPENVLVTRDGLVKVTDFGVASLTNAAGQAISAGGTLGYMPPEQLRGAVVDARTDAWAYAALAFEVLTGAVPFGADSIDEALSRAETLPLPLPSEFEPAISSDVDEILLEALAPDPDDRPAEIALVANDLLACLGDAGHGRHGLAELVSELTAEDDYEIAEAMAHLGAWDRMASRVGLAQRMLVALASGYLAWAGLSVFPLGWAAPLAAIAIAAAGGWFAPPLGLGAGVVLYGAGAFAISPALGVGFWVAAAAWWFAVGRHDAGAGAAPAVVPAASVVGATAGIPLLTGFFVERLRHATASAFVSGLVAGYLRAALARPDAWLLSPVSIGLPGLGGPALRPADAAIVLVTAAAYAVSALFTGLGSRRGTRSGAAVGALAGITVLALSSLPQVTGASRWDPGAVIQLVIASILMVVVIALGPPVRGDGDVEADDEHPV